MISFVRGMLLEGLQRRPPENGAQTEMIATTTSWAMYGAAKQWVSMRDHLGSKEIADTIMRMIMPILWPPAVLPTA